jgi:hypothetical protein
MKGLMEEEIFARNCLLHRGLLSAPGYRAYWNAQRAEIATIAPKFWAFVDSLCSEDARESTSSSDPHESPNAFADQ